MKRMSYVPVKVPLLTRIKLSILTLIYYVVYLEWVHPTHNIVLKEDPEGNYVNIVITSKPFIINYETE